MELLRLCFLATLVRLAHFAGEDQSQRSASSSGSSWEQLSSEFDSLMATLNSGAEAILEYIGDEDGCKFKCKNGARPVKNPEHTPSSNGCGSMGIQIDTRLAPGLTDCCHQHDICYDTCKRDKDDCDTEFKRCLEKICKQLKPLASSEVYKSCQNVAALMYSSTMALGCKSYREAQAQACRCPDPGLPGSRSGSGSRLGSRSGSGPRKREDL